MPEDTLKVLICDDSFLMRKKLKESLQICGCEDIIEACDGQAAVDMYKEFLPDLVFMDIIMPIKDGIQALKEIKHIDKSARIAMASSSYTTAHIKDAIRAGAFEFIQKPWHQEQIAKIISNILHSKQ